MALAEPFFFRVRDALFVPPLNRNTKHARFASGASLERRAPTREKEGRYAPIRGVSHFLARTSRGAKFASSLLFLRFGPVAVPRGVALQISPPSLLLKSFGKRRFDEEP